VLVTSIQLMFGGYLSLVAYDIAAEGAALAATADAGQEDVTALVAKTSATLIGGVAAEVAVDHEPIQNHSLSRVSVSMASPLLFFGAIRITQTASAVDEIR